MLGNLFLFFCFYTYSTRTKSFVIQFRNFVKYDENANILFIHIFLELQFVYVSRYDKSKEEHTVILYLPIYNSSFDLYRYWKRKFLSFLHKHFFLSFFFLVGIHAQFYSPSILANVEYGIAVSSDIFLWFWDEMSCQKICPTTHSFNI